MRLRIASISKTSLLLATLFLTGAARPQSATVTPARGESATARNIIEVRLRKLHLARPDLIPYPILSEIYC